MTYFMGTDIGGTFTDLAMLDDKGKVLIVKSPTTPHNRTEGVLNAIAEAARQLDMTPADLMGELAYFAHGTTAATNAFIERKGAKTGLLTTLGFRDTMRFQRCMASWAGLGDHEIAHYSARTIPVPIVPLELIEQVSERIDSRGQVVVALDEEKARESIKRLVDEGVEAIAITLLWSFRNPVHEDRLAAMVKEIAPNIFVTTSSALVPVLGEYERTSTTAINSYLGPVIHRYIQGLETAIRSFGFDGPISIMDSGGGVLPSNEAAYQAANLLTSGPAGGVLASQKLGEQLGFKNILTTDMGGTSFDVGMIVNGEPQLETLRETGRFHVALPSIKVTAIGAGGGSLARVTDGHLTVGPHSAGAMPGPAAFGRGGTEPTITDADIVLGIIDPHYFLGGFMKLDVERAEKAIFDHVAKPLGITLHEAAMGIHEVSNNQMADLLRRVTTRSGYDPRQFVVFAYGGAGPTHAYQYSTAAGIGTTVVPVTASAHSAFGCVTADRHRSFSVAFGRHAPARFKKASEHVDGGALTTAFTQLEQRCRDALDKNVRITRNLAMRFRQQVHEIEISVQDGPLGPADVDGLVDKFEKRYEDIYGKGAALRQSGVEFVRLRVEGISPVPRPTPTALTAQKGKATPVAERPVHFYGKGAVATPVYRSEKLGTGAELEGPAIVERPDTTIVVGPGQRLSIEQFGNYIIRPSTQERR